MIARLLMYWYIVLFHVFWQMKDTTSEAAKAAVPVIDITPSFPSSHIFEGYMVAFGDINNDQHIDIFVLSGDGKNITVLLGSSQELGFSIMQVLSMNLDVTALFPGDYNGDGYLDFLVTFKEDSDLSFRIFWNDLGYFSAQNLFVPNHRIKDQPLMLDANADMIPDLLISFPNNTREFLLGNTAVKNWNFDYHKFETSSGSDYGNIRIPNSNAFVDLTGEGSADIFVTAVAEDGTSDTIFETWQGTPMGLKLVDNASISEKDLYIGQSLFVDFNGDTVQDHLIPVCTIKNNKCTASRILMYHNKNWVEVFKAEDDWNFIRPQPNSKKNQSITLVGGDYNQDIYVDVLCIMQQTNKKGERYSKAVVLYGALCKNDYCMRIGRQFVHAFVANSSDGAFSAAFYDLKGDGTLDFLVSVEKDSKVYMRVYRNTVADDVSFLMAKVLPGFLTNSSSNVAGCVVTYKTTNTMGGVQHASAVQLPQSAYLALQLPFVNFGLGRLPNFIDSLKVCIPTSLLPFPTSSSKNPPLESLCNTWTMIIPNSQLFITPHPITSPTSWKNQLHIIPSRNVVTTAIVLLSACGCVVLAIVVMHCLERREDKQEKNKDAQRFHFDAM